MFSGLSKTQLGAIAKSSKERTFQAGEAIVREGDSGVAFYLMLDGRAEVRHQGRLLSKLGSGQFFGEMALLDNQPRSADVVAVEPTKCLVLWSPTFWGLVSTNPKIARGLLQEVARRLRVTNKALSE